MGKTFWIIAAIVIVLGAYYFLQSDYSIQDLDNEIKTLETPSNSNYPKWDHFPVSYYFTDGKICGDYELRRIRSAFNIIQNETNRAISFVETNNTGDINIICSSDYKPGGAQPGTYTSGEGGYNSQGNKITDGTIYFLHMGAGRYTGGCLNIPNIEIHEILHTFALGHSENEHSIMAPISNSNSCMYDQIDNETVSILNGIYHFE